jgi:hypothetical protein
MTMTLHTNTNGLHDILCEGVLRFSHNYAIATTDNERGITDLSLVEFLDHLPPHYKNAYIALYELTKHDKVPYDAWAALRQERALRHLWLAKK